MLSEGDPPRTVSVSIIRKSNVVLSRDELKENIKFPASDPMHNGIKSIDSSTSSINLLLHIISFES